MPTVSSHDILGPMSWGSNRRQAAFAENNVDRGMSDMSMSPLHGEGNFTSSCAQITSDHAYATGGGPPRFVSDNGYYGYHPAVINAAGSDCSMDTSENNLSLGEHPNSCAGAFGGADVLNADLITWNSTRKRNFEPDHEMDRAMKRSRCSTNGGTGEEASTQAMAQGSGVHTSTPSIADQSHSPALTYDLPMHQLPGSTTHLMDAMTPRPRCLMGHFI